MSSTLDCCELQSWLLELPDECQTHVHVDQVACGTNIHNPGKLIVPYNDPYIG